MHDYLGGDVYHALAQLVRLNRRARSAALEEARPSATRDRMKPLQLGINYGMGVPSLARGLDRHPLIASEIIERHKRRYPRFWQWRADMVQAAMLDRAHRERLRLAAAPHHEPQPAHALQFPDAIGRSRNAALAAVRLCDAGIVPIMLVHDGILFEETDREKIEHAKEIMRARRPRRLRRLRDRRRRRSDADRRRSLSRQAARWRRRCGRRS